MSIYTHCIFADLLFLSLMLSKILKDPDNSDGILVPWLVFFIVSVVVQSQSGTRHGCIHFVWQVGIIAFGVKIRLLIRAIRLHREELGFNCLEEGGRSGLRAKLFKHRSFISQNCAQAYTHVRTMPHHHRQARTGIQTHTYTQICTHEHTQICTYTMHACKEMHVCTQPHAHAYQYPLTHMHGFK